MWVLLFRNGERGSLISSLLVATHNPGKLKELRYLFSDLSVKILSLSEVGINSDVEETCGTLEENAELKARTYGDLSGLCTVADDSGLEVAALNGAPGVFSARYAGEHATDMQRIAKLHQNLRKEGKPWRARFRCVMAVNLPGTELSSFEGICDGEIIDELRGGGGFGYDPIFVPKCMDRTMSEITEIEKNEISHRAKAARKVVEHLRNYYK